jgi:hypothetical protein
MSTVRKIGPKLALFSIIFGLLLVGWATRYSIAQNPPQDAPPPVAPGQDTSPQPEKTAPAPQAPAASSTELQPLPAPGPADSLAVPSLNAASDIGHAARSSKAEAPAPVTVAGDLSPVRMEDPERVASAFLEQNQKLAEAQLKALKEEAEKLRARLTKVEAGIKRWDRLLVALNQSQGTAADEQAPAKAQKVLPASGPAVRDDLPPPDSDPTELSPVRPEPTLRVPQSPPEATKPANSSGDLVPR